MQLTEALRNCEESESASLKIKESYQSTLKRCRELEKQMSKVGNNEQLIEL